MKKSKLIKQLSEIKALVINLRRKLGERSAKILVLQKGLDVLLEANDDLANINCDLEHRLKNNVKELNTKGVQEENNAGFMAKVIRYVREE